MDRTLQHNFDIIQYLVTNASPEQWLWRKDAGSHSLKEIVEQLYRLEVWHAACLCSSNAACQKKSQAFAEALSGQPHQRDAANIKHTFEAYACHRRQTIALLQNIDFSRDQTQFTHKLFGRVTLPDLLAEIEAYDQAHIRRIEEIIRAMPLNPLMARAVYEIEQYYRRYRPYLKRAGSVLDIGVGPGLALRYLMLQNPHITFAGVDVRDLRLPGVDAPLIVYDGRTLPFTANQFDASLLFYVLHHCQNPLRVLAEAIRVTRQNLIIIEEFDDPEADETSLDLTERQSHQALGLPPDLPYQLFDKADFETMLSQHHLVELEQVMLPSETSRPVHKYLYVLQVKNG